MNLTNTLTIHRLQVIKDALGREPLTLPQVAVRVHLSLEATRKYLRYMHKERMIRIAAWPEVDTARLMRVPAYILGRAPDEARPRRLTPAECTEAWRNRIRSDPERLDLYKAKQRAQSRKPARDELVAAFFGVAHPSGARDACAEDVCRR